MKKTYFYDAKEKNSECDITRYCNAMELKIYFYMNFISSTPLLCIFYSWTKQAHPHGTTLLGEPGSPKRDVL